ncbi:MAG TPA: alpha/beta hydrolase, partial [Nitrososphaeraceae archaeon]|nr:alpha/beta hydrolase [Nitrososphaeraceae archaeon]
MLKGENITGISNLRVNILPRLSFQELVNTFINAWVTPITGVFSIFVVSIIVLVRYKIITSSGLLMKTYKERIDDLYRTYQNKEVLATTLWAVQKPINASIFSEKSGPPAWSQHPTWYQISENDKSIPPDIERMFAKQMNATIISLPASHVSYISHPNEVADFILNA